MSMRSCIIGFAVALCAIASTSCSDTSDSSPDSLSSASTSAPPRQVESGFDFTDDAFVFANFGGDVSPRLNPRLVSRMFGEDVACKKGMAGCQLTEPARAWMEATNATLDQGRSEGFSILALLFHTGDLDPKDFGGEQVADLRIETNIDLQEEFAYWAATQAVPSALENDVRYQAKEVVPFLARALDPEGEERYRMAIAQRTPTGFARGHALVPIAYYKGEGQTYIVRVYDNNFPQVQRELFIDAGANTWRYEVPGFDGTPIVYEGNEDNGNLLYFSPVRERTGKLVAPFGADSSHVTITTYGVTVVAKGEDGAETGIRDGQILEAEGEKVTPAFSRCPLCGTPVPIVNQALLDKGIRSKSVEVTGGMGVDVMKKAAAEGKEPFITGSGKGFTTTIKPGEESHGDTADIGEDGSVTYDANDNDGGVTIEVTQTNDDGSSTTISVTVAATESGAKVTVGKDADGKPTVEVEGVPEDTNVTVGATTTKADGTKKTETTTFGTGSGTSSKATVDVEGGRVDATNTNEITASHCANGVFDEGKETDIDCGGDRCSACVATTTLATTPKCSVGPDCDTGVCTDGRCIRNAPIYIAFADGAAPAAPITFDLGVTIDGTFERMYDIKSADILAAPDKRLKIGDGFEFTASFTTKCVVDYTTQYTGLEGASDTTEEGVIEVSCPSEDEHVATISATWGRESSGYFSSSDPVLVGVSFDGGPERILSISNGGDNNVGLYTTEWSARIIRSPKELRRSASDPYAVGKMSIFCRFAPSRYTSQYTVSLHAESQTKSGDDATMYLNCYGSFIRGSTSSTLDGRACSNGIRDRDESSKDCGGSYCTGCAVRVACYLDSDCIDPNANYCEEGVCQPNATCNDGRQNQGETDIDCSGACADKCSSGKTCDADSDCLSGLSCNMYGVCATPACSDGVWASSSETDTDCGSGCPACPTGLRCNANSDCRYSKGDACDAGLCTVSSCQDGQKNEDESDVDCGGGLCNACGISEACTLDTDCTTSACTCGEASSACTGATGQCGAEKWAFDQPTTDGVAPTGRATIPARCNEVHIQAWGAAGSMAWDSLFGDVMGPPGGGGGYVSGTIDVTPGDELIVWIGGGGNDAPFAASTASVGSKTGTVARGGQGRSEASTGSYGGDGGGLTSVLQSGSASTSFSVPAGAGGGDDYPGVEPDVMMGIGGGTFAPSGRSGQFGGQGGGGAGDPGGTYGTPGAYGMLPMTLMGGDGSFGVPAGTSNPDYSRCRGTTGGTPGAGEADSVLGVGGDGCVIIRCTGK